MDLADKIGPLDFEIAYLEGLDLARMSKPLAWSISHDDKLIVVQVTRTLSVAEVQGAYAAIAAAGALSYRKLVDLRFAPLELGAVAIHKLADVAAAATRDLPMGPVAFVINREIAAEMIEVFDRNMRVDRPLRVFTDTESAMRWLDST